jgi:SnoaL-like domain
MRPLFAADAVFEVGPFDTYRGRNEIVRKLEENNKTRFHWTIHYLVGPEIKVATDAAEAEAFFYLWEPAATPKPDRAERAYWIGGWYDAQLISEDGLWRFSFLRLTLKLLSRYDEGWRAMPRSFGEL